MAALGPGGAHRSADFRTSFAALIPSVIAVCCTAERHSRLRLRVSVQGKRMAMIVVQRWARVCPLHLRAIGAQL